MHSFIMVVFVFLTVRFIQLNTGFFLVLNRAVSAQEVCLWKTSTVVIDFITVRGIRLIIRPPIDFILSPFV